MDEYTKAMMELVQDAHKRGHTVTATLSNETMHLDPKTGALVSDSYTEEVIEIPPPINPL